MKLLSLLAFILIGTISHAQTISAYRVKDSIGKTATVCGSVTGTHTTDKVMLLNMGGKYPDNAFTVAIDKDSAATFSYQLATLDGADICVTGLVKEYKGKPEIEVTNEKQIKLQSTLIKPHQ